MDHAHGHTRSSVPMGLSKRTRRTYGSSAAPARPKNSGRTRGLEGGATAAPRRRGVHADSDDIGESFLSVASVSAPLVLPAVAVAVAELLATATAAVFSNLFIFESAANTSSTPPPFAACLQPRDFRAARATPARRPERQNTTTGVSGKMAWDARKSSVTTEEALLRETGQCTTTKRVPVDALLSAGGRCGGCATSCASRTSIRTTFGWRRSSSTRHLVGNSLDVEENFEVTEVLKTRLLL
mmetsp:Transcript_32849/g.67123  ORF Transcript_32849/g.67123 Transcript_32849/m.67123 type:complete len:241 (-) Transcript_32849:182-904(-)